MLLFWPTIFILVLANKYCHPHTYVLLCHCFSTPLRFMQIQKHKLVNTLDKLLACKKDKSYDVCFSNL